MGYGANYSSGSEFDEGQMRSLDNYRASMKNENKSYGKRIKNFKNLNYEMEDPEGFDYLRNNELKDFSKNLHTKIYAVPDESIIYFEDGIKHEEGIIYYIDNQEN